MSAIIEGQGTAKKAKYARFSWPIFRGIVVIVAAWGFIAFVSADVYGGKLGFTAFTVKARRYRLPEWSLLAYLSFSVWAATGNAYFSGSLGATTFSLLQSLVQRL
jgi:hypothetical protein